MPLLAAKAYPKLHPDRARGQLIARFLSAEGPMVNNVTVTDTDRGIYRKLTDVGEYTGESLAAAGRAHATARTQCPGPMHCFSL